MRVASPNKQVLVETIASYKRHEDAARDKEVLANARIFSSINGTAARGYTLIVMKGMFEKAKAILEKTKA